MNVLFLTLVGFESLQERNLYTDMLRKFVEEKHHVYVISPVEKRQNRATHLIEEENATILRLQIGNTQKTNIIEKGISTIMIEPTYMKAIRQYFSHVRFDLVLYSTPPITLVSPVEYVRKRDGAKTYLLLKDIFPQNAVDLGMMQTSGVRSLLWRYFRQKEKRLYALSDYIGCMSPANCRYLLAHNPEIHEDRVEVCPNVAEAEPLAISEQQKRALREKYGIPPEKRVFVYGGNLGKPQGIPFVIECLRRQASKQAFFLIVGNGTEYETIRQFIRTEQPQNVLLLKGLPKEDYELLVCACDIGMIFLDHRFTIPNFPSRLLSYMRSGLPVLAATDPNTDIGEFIEKSGFGWKTESNDAEAFLHVVETILHTEESEIERMRKASFRCLEECFAPDAAYKTIVNHFEEQKQ